jgi:hypothetical protein
VMIDVRTTTSPLPITGYHGYLLQKPHFAFYNQELDTFGTLIVFSPFRATHNTSDRRSTSNTTMDAHLVRVQPSHADKSNQDALPLAMPPSTSGTPETQEEGHTKPSGSILHSIDLEEIDPTVFRSIGLWTPAGARGAFGGQVIAQALNAAVKTVTYQEDGGKPWGLHSQHVSLARRVQYAQLMVGDTPFIVSRHYSVTFCYRKHIHILLDIPRAAPQTIVCVQCNS